MTDEDRIDLDGLAAFIEEHPFHMSPEELLEDALMSCCEDPTPLWWYEANGILNDWLKLQEDGEGLSTEQKKFIAEAFFTKHKFIGL
jgi:hypothetical protein